MNSRLITLIIVAASLAMILAGCGGDDPPTATPTPAPSADGAGSGSDFQSEYDALVAAAQEEGEIVTFICCGVGRAVGKIAPVFEEKFGVTWTNSTGGSEQQADKILAERDAGKYTLDVWMGGISTANVRLIPGGVLAPLKPLLFFPEVVDESNCYSGKIVWMDPGTQDRIIPYGLNASNAPFSVNTDLVKPGDINSYWDLLEPEWHGKIVMRDPRSENVGNTMPYYYNHPDLGEEYMRRLLTETGAVITSDARQAAEWLAAGQYAICMFGCSREVGSAQADGLPVEAVYSTPLKEGAIVGVGGSTMYAVDNPPNPNAQKLFINLWLTKEGQYLMQSTDGTNSVRTDIAKDNVRADRVIRDDVDYGWPESNPDHVRNIGAALERNRAFLAEIGL